ncbi:MAG TPA: YchJ family metal-binding protein, partial [Microthrixaceae bacterium]|nr:YchJ family metal-binding protein [Microthrixaceae bacterium]
STAEALMRSRYSAFAKGLADYLLHSWHPETRPETLDLDPAQRWIGLRVLTSSDGGVDDDVGTVAFEADHASGRRVETMRERSTFERYDGRWVYVSGTV